MILVLLSTVGFGGNSKAWIDGLKQLAGAGAAATAAAASGGSVQAVLAGATAIATGPTLPILGGIVIGGIALAALLEDDD